MALAQTAANSARALTPSNRGVFIYRLGVSIPERKAMGTDTAI